MNRYALIAVKQEARHAGFFAAKEANLHLPEYVDLQMFIAIHPPDRRRRDDDNVLASLKSYRDGIFDALQINDSYVRISTHGFAKMISGGAVYVWIQVLDKYPEWMELSHG